MARTKPFPVVSVMVMVTFASRFVQPVGGVIWMPVPKAVSPARAGAAKAVSISIVASRMARM